MKKREIKKELEEIVFIDDIKLKVKYSFKRIKNLYIRIEPENNVLVSIPYRMTEHEARKFFNDKKDWIIKAYKKLKKKERVKEEIRKDKKYIEEEFNQIVFDNVDELSNSMNLYPKKVVIKKLKYAWGSCSNKRNISINSDLIYYEKDIIRYVIIHELAHLKYMNHSDKFWNLVEIFDKDYKEHRKILKNR